MFCCYFVFCVECDCAVVCECVMFVRETMYCIPEYVCDPNESLSVPFICYVCVRILSKMISAFNNAVNEEPQLLAFLMLLLFCIFVVVQVEI